MSDVSGPISSSSTGRAGHLQSQLYLTVVIALMPDHVLEVKQGMIVVNLHLLAMQDAALNRVAHGFSAHVQFLCHTVRVAFVKPLSWWQLGGELRSILGDEDQPYKVDVREHFRYGRTSDHHPGLQSARRQTAQQLDENPIVPLPRVANALAQACRPYRLPH